MNKQLLKGQYVRILFEGEEGTVECGEPFCVAENTNLTIPIADTGLRLIIRGEPGRPCIMTHDGLSIVRTSPGAMIEYYFAVARAKKA